jgi:hypothetical protein
MKSSIQTFFNAIHGSLNDDESYRFDITRDGDSLSIVLIPLLKDDSESVPREAQQIRAALSTPLIIKDMPLAELAGQFEARLSAYGDAYKPAQTAYNELLASLKDAKATAKNTSTKQTGKEPQKAVLSKDENSKNEEAKSESDNNDSKTASGVLDF